jgi:hypothetical protein
VGLSVGSSGAVSVVVSTAVMVSTAVAVAGCVGRGVAVAGRAAAAFVASGERVIRKVGAETGMNPASADAVATDAVTAGAAPMGAAQPARSKAMKRTKVRFMVPDPAPGSAGIYFEGDRPDGFILPDRD